jgi:hypothetical protein
MTDTAFDASGELLKDAPADWEVQVSIGGRGTPETTIGITGRISPGPDPVPARGVGHEESVTGKVHGEFIVVPVFLETTAGRVVLLQENPRYYRGWSFESPKKYKEFCYQHSYTP